MKKHETPMDVLVEYLNWHTPEMGEMIDRTEAPTGGGSFMGNFWSYCMKQGFQGHTAGTANFPQSHGWYLHPKDKRKFRAWLKKHLQTIGLLTPNYSKL